MSVIRLSTRLPPFARDYSGACAALFDFGGMLVIHGSDGCTGNYTGYDEARWYGSPAQVVGSSLRELDVVMGNDAKLISRVLEQARRTRPNFVAIVGTPVPMIVGTDFEGIATEIERSLGIPCMGFGTTGYGRYDEGVSAALLNLARRFCPRRPRQSGTMNIIGGTSLDYCKGESLARLRALCAARGWKVAASIGLGGAFEELANAGSAAVNLVVAAGGLAAARYFERDFGIPCVAGVPAGEQAADALFSLLDREGRGAERERPGAPAVLAREDDAPKDILIIGEEVMANAVRNCLAMDYGVRGVAVCTPFGRVPGLALPGDSAMEHEAELRAEMGRGYRVIIGDPVLRRALPPQSGAVFINWPLPAVSGKLYWRYYRSIVGDAVKKLAAEIPPALT
jgi:nitrogenase molybdenum-iron protein alpha/beta subunit